MYRSYENPYDLERKLEAVQFEYDMMVAEGAPIETLISVQEEIYELKDRINFAWQDDEYDEMNRDFADEMWMWENVWGV